MVKENKWKTVCKPTFARTTMCASRAEID